MRVEREDDVHAMSQDIIVPQLYCPFPSKLNPHTDATAVHVIDWARQQKLVPFMMSERKFGDIRVAELAGRTFSRVLQENLEIVAAWNGWLHFWDDQCDEADIGKMPAVLAKREARFREILRGDRARRDDGPIVHSLQDICDRLFQGPNDDWIERFVQRVSAYFDACIWEAKNRAAAHVPDVSTYIVRRRDSGAVYTEFALFERAYGIALPAEVRDHPTLERLSTSANNIISWTNDIISLDKEMARGDYHNLVLTLRHEHGLALQEAVHRAAGFIEGALREFLEVAAALPSFGAALDAAMHEYVSFLQDWIRGNIDWSLSSGRFRPGSAILATPG